jgi:transcription-repair coupling factor (superfamily II helicase)
MPNVNTIFIDDAHSFGLADLHHLRGRVGRYRNQAFACLFLPRGRAISRSARRRLDAIQEFDELGAGFKLAMRDLEIRGAGNLLGREQSGHIAAVGYDTYCRLLSDAIKNARNQPSPEPEEVEIDIEAEAYLPASYVPTARRRIELYRKAGAARDMRELEEIESDLKDRFGQPPREALDFLTKHRLRLRAGELGINYVGHRPPEPIKTCGPVKTSPQTS